jgi:hypothetical protein
MLKKYIVFVLIPALLIQLYGCYGMQDIPKDKIAGLKEGGDLLLQTRDSTIYFFEETNYHISNDSLYGRGFVKYSDAADFKIVNKEIVALTNIESVQQDELKLYNTTLLIIVGVLLAVIVGYFIFN